MLKVADLSNWQTPDLSQYPADAYIFKATEGCSYVDPHCDPFVQQAKAAGKPWGIYHFMDNSNWQEQANFFLSNCQGYFGECLVVLDYEGDGRQGAGVAKAWLDYVTDSIGYKPLIYMNSADEVGDDWREVIGGDYGLWLANYPTNDGRDEDPEACPITRHWPQVAMWQYSSNPYDRSWFYGDEETWQAYIAYVRNVQSQQAPLTEKYQVGDLVKLRGEEATHWADVYTDQVDNGGRSLGSLPIDTGLQGKTFQVTWLTPGQKVELALLKDDGTQGQFRYVAYDWDLVIA